MIELNGVHQSPREAQNAVATAAAVVVVSVAIVSHADNVARNLLLGSAETEWRGGGGWDAASTW